MKPQTYGLILQQLEIQSKAIETKETGYRSMEWDSTNKRWVVADAGEIMPKQTK